MSWLLCMVAVCSGYYLSAPHVLRHVYAMGCRYLVLEDQTASSVLILIVAHVDDFFFRMPTLDGW